MPTVKIYSNYCFEGVMLREIGPHFSLTPWGKNTRDIVGEGDKGKDYTLPDGYYVGHSDDGLPRIYDAHDSYCELTSVKGHPAVCINAPHPLMLKEAE